MSLLSDSRAARIRMGIRNMVNENAPILNDDARRELTNKIYQEVWREMEVRPRRMIGHDPIFEEAK